MKNIDDCYIILTFQFSKSIVLKSDPIRGYKDIMSAAHMRDHKNRILSAYVGTTVNHEKYGFESFKELEEIYKNGK